MSTGTFYSLWHFDECTPLSWGPMAASAIEVLQGHPGFVEAHVGHSVDEPGTCFVHTTWSDVGSYRRALSSTESKLKVWPWLGGMRHGASAFESLLSADAHAIETFDSSLDDA